MNTFRYNFKKSTL